jgi:hypothetical protein
MNLFVFDYILHKFIFTFYMLLISLFILVSHLFVFSQRMSRECFNFSVLILLSLKLFQISSFHSKVNLALQVALFQFRIPRVIFEPRRSKHELGNPISKVGVILLQKCFKFSVTKILRLAQPYNPYRKNHWSARRRAC